MANQDDNTQGAGGGWRSRLNPQEMLRSVSQPMEPVRAQEVSSPPAQQAPGDVDFDNRGQMERIQGGIVAGETLHAVYDMKGGGTGFIGLTDRRLIIQDEGRVRKKRSLISVPYSQISMVASQDEGGIMRSTSEMTIITTSGQEFEFEFRSGQKAERAYNIIITNLR